MGRSIPSVSRRIEERLGRWEGFARHLGKEEQEAFRALVVVIKDRRGAIDAADEADIGVAMLLSMMVRMQGRMDAQARRARGP